MAANILVTRSFDPARSHPFLSSKFKRRDPNVHFYLPIECPLLKNCTEGSCPLAHTKLEVIFHPIVYKTRKCKMVSMGSCSFPQKCTFYNNDSEKMAAQLLWLAWEKTWDLWRINIEAVLSSHNKLNSNVAKNLSIIKNYRGNMKQFLKTINGTNNGRSLLDGRLDSILRSQFSTSAPNAGTDESRSQSLPLATPNNWSFKFNGVGECLKFSDLLDLSPSSVRNFDASDSDSYASLILNSLRNVSQKTI
ncbi:erythrocyte membrane protein [Babesia ovata]|uniref:Erythrocyte membrane protein n=1 Tax=Babesia ovata TaxID=189622 RepID=A0A2H6KBZ6_9APIC|nr:erythrocyte membrane protein [Babesia ovata]GBE60520.1 erythrocyte membrane protein [Babesia ovata]